jgi:hypothetical protein
MKTVKVNEIPNIKQTKIVYLWVKFSKINKGLIVYKANKYLVLPLQSEPSDPKDILNLILATHRWKKETNNPQPQQTHCTAIAKNQQPTAVADS